MGLSSEWALICGGSDLDVFLSSLGTACKREGASHRIWISGRASLRVEKTGPQGDPDHAVSDRHLWAEFSDLHLYDGCECLPLRCTRIRSALLHDGRGHRLRSLVRCQSAETKLSVSYGGGWCLRARLFPGRTGAWILVVRGHSHDHRRGWPDLQQRHKQHHAALYRTSDAGQGYGSACCYCTRRNTDWRTDRRMGCQSLRPSLGARYWRWGGIHRCPGRSLRSGPQREPTARRVISPVKRARGLAERDGVASAIQRASEAVQ